ncbi:MAG: hypothetical protein M0R66_07100 [Candidatus Omnitrophica bacterium]|nr:hypothetical protein [Candidatus Omnitrophota bacterium]
METRTIIAIVVAIVIAIIAIATAYFLRSQAQLASRKAKDGMPIVIDHEEQVIVNSSDGLAFIRSRFSGVSADALAQWSAYTANTPERGALFVIRFGEFVFARGFLMSPGTRDGVFLFVAVGDPARLGGREYILGFAGAPVTHGDSFARLCYLFTKDAKSVVVAQDQGMGVMWTTQTAAYPLPGNAIMRAEHIVVETIIDLDVARSLNAAAPPGKRRVSLEEFMSKPVSPYDIKMPDTHADLVSCDLQNAFGPRIPAALVPFRSMSNAFFAGRVRDDGTPSGEIGAVVIHDDGAGARVYVIAGGGDLLANNTTHPRQVKPYPDSVLWSILPPTVVAQRLGTIPTQAEFDARMSAQAAENDAKMVKEASYGAGEAIPIATTAESFVRPRTTPAIRMYRS